MHSSAFLEALTIVLGVAAITTVLCQRLRQPIVLGYIVAGLVIGPHVPVPLVASAEVVHELSEVGVILLMFALGLEFSIGRLLRVGPTAAVTSIVQCSLMLWLGFLVGRSLGWTAMESVFTGAIIAISSTTIIAKAFADQGITGRQREIVVGILIVEDLIAVLLMAGLTTVATGRGLSAAELARTVGRLVGFLALLLSVGMIVIPRAIQYLRRFEKPEINVISAMAIAFGVASLCLELGYSVALGAFLAGSLNAESGDGELIEHQIRPVRDVFAAVFFVSVGMAVDPALVAQHWLAVTLLTVAVIVGKIVSVALGVFLTGNGVRLSVASGMSLAQIGEFSFIIAGLGLSLGVTRDFLYPVAVAVSAVTTLSTPWFIRAAAPAASIVDRALPAPLQTVATLYGSWLERLRSGKPRDTFGRRTRRNVALLVVDLAALVGVMIAASLGHDRLVVRLGQELQLAASAAHVVVVAGAALLALPFAIGVLRRALRLGATIAHAVFPAAKLGAMDLAQPPRRALVAILRLVLVLAVTLPVIALTQPFIAGVPGVIVLVAALTTVAIAVWRSARNLHGHVRSGAEAIVEVLAEQGRAARAGAESTITAAAASAAPPQPLATLEMLRELLPGIGDPDIARVASRSRAAGQTLGALDVRGRTGATIFAIERGGNAIAFPGQDATLQPGDVVALGGTREAIVAARTLLESID
jgi:CPA2 family monovalent cation:H+ antiporter-2